MNKSYSQSSPCLNLRTIIKSEKKQIVENLKLRSINSYMLCRNTNTCGKTLKGSE